MAHVHKVASVVKHFTGIYFCKAHHAFKQYCFARATLANNKVCFTLLKLAGKIFGYMSFAKVLVYMLQFYHAPTSNNLASTKSNTRISMLQYTTALVLDLPTSSAPPSVW